jgi:hypothetical protein
MMEHLLNIIKNPTLEGILGLFISAGILLIYNQGRRIFHSVKLLEYKQIATKHALGESLGNGFLDSYKKKLDELKSDNKFIIKGE